MSLPTVHPPTHELAILYAQAMDERRTDLIERIFVDDAIIEGVDVRLAGRAAIARMAASLGTGFFGKTLHCVTNHSAVVDGDGAGADATTYCTAYHLLKAEPSALIWHIRYLDRCVRRNGEWRLAHRRLVLEFTQTQPVNPGPG